MYFNGTANYLARQLIKLHVRGVLLFTVSFVTTKDTKSTKNP